MTGVYMFFISFYQGDTGAPGSPGAPGRIGDDVGNVKYQKVFWY